MRRVLPLSLLRWLLKHMNYGKMASSWCRTLSFSLSACACMCLCVRVCVCQAQSIHNVGLILVANDLRLFPFPACALAISP